MESYNRGMGKITRWGKNLSEFSISHETAKQRFPVFFSCLFYGWGFCSWIWQTCRLRKSERLLR